MPFTNRNDYLDGRKPVVFPAGGEVVAVRFPIDLVAADLDANDTGAVALLPAGCVPVGLVFDSDDLDTNASPTISASVGPINAGETDLHLPCPVEEDPSTPDGVRPSRGIGLAGRFALRVHVAVEGGGILDEGF